MQVVFPRKLDRLATAEMVFVRIVVSRARGPFLDRTRRVITTLSNGWLYIAASFLIVFSREARRPLLASFASVAVAFIPYLLIKRAMARLRPCDLDPMLGCKVKALDQFSCPSGHCMAAIAFGIPIVYAFPAAALAVAAWVLLISWARIAVGHHYPSDLILGLLIGASVSLPVSTMLL